MEVIDRHAEQAFELLARPKSPPLSMVSNHGTRLGITLEDQNAEWPSLNGADRDPGGTPAIFAQKKMAGTKVPAKFEQGGFTSGRREGPQTLFPGASPGNLHRHQAPTETRYVTTHAST